jgi:hypothetical protein
MNDEFERIRKEVVLAKSRYYFSSICLKEHRKPIKKSQRSS